MPCFGREAFSQLKIRLLPIFILADGKEPTAELRLPPDLMVHDLLGATMLYGGDLTRLTALDVGVPAEELLRFWAALRALQRLRLLGLNFGSGSKRANRCGLLKSLSLQICSSLQRLGFRRNAV